MKQDKLVFRTTAVLAIVILAGLAAVAQPLAGDHPQLGPIAFNWAALMVGGLITPVLSLAKIGAAKLANPGGAITPLNLNVVLPLIALCSVIVCVAAFNNVPLISVNADTVTAMVNAIGGGLISIAVALVPSAED